VEAAADVRDLPFGYFIPALLVRPKVGCLEFHAYKTSAAGDFFKSLKVTYVYMYIYIHIYLS
jgi:hypothetical protein